MKDPERSGSLSRRDVLRAGTYSAVGLALAGTAAARGGSAGPLRSAGVLSFGPDNVLFVGTSAAPPFMPSRSGRRI